MDKEPETEVSNERMRSVRRRLSWIIWGTLAVLIFLLASAFSRAWLTNQALRKQVQILEPMLTAANDEQATLNAELTRVQSDVYVEQWARENAGMTQPGEVLVIPVRPSKDGPLSMDGTPSLTPLPSPTPSPIPTPTPMSFWKTWLDILRGSE